MRPLFQAGHYRDGKKRARGDGILDRYEADQLIEAVGLPVRFNNVSLAASMATSTAEASYRPTFEWYSWLLRSMHSHYDEAFEDYFGRLAIARLPQEEADQLIAACSRSVDYWLDKFESAKLPKDRSDFGTALDALRLYIMALAHLTVRMPVADAMAAYRKGITLARNSHISHHWIVEAIGKLLTYAAESIPKDQRGQLAEDAIDFPLSSEKGVQNNFLWPKVATTLWGTVPQRADNPHWHHRIALLIEAARNSSAREEAVLLLSYLAEKGALLDAERVSFGEALWSQLDGDANPLPAKSGLLESTYLDLPAPPDVDVAARVRARVMDSNVDQILTLPKPLSSGVLADKQNQLYALQNTKALGLPLSANRALELFLQFLSWSPTPGKRNDPFSTSMIDGFNDGLRRVIGDILAYVVVPAMAAEARTAGRGQALIEFIGLNQIWRALPALPYFVASDNALYSDAVTAIRRAIWGGDHQQVGSAAVAVGTWARLADEGDFGRNIPIPLKDGVLAAVEARPEHGLGTLLQVAKQLAETGFFVDDDRLRLVGALEKSSDRLAIRRNCRSQHACCLGVTGACAVR